MRLRGRVLGLLAVLLIGVVAALFWFSRPLPVLTVTSWAGAYGRAQASALMRPYSAEKSVDVRLAQWDGDLADIQQAVAHHQYKGDVIDFELPDRATLLTVLDTLCHEPDASGELTRILDLPTGDELDAILDAAAGLTTAEAEDAFALSLTLHGTFQPATILAEKAATIRKNGLVEYLEPKLTLSDVGGWDAFKTFIQTLRHSFTKTAANYGLKPIKGVLIVGQPGCGKSLIAEIIGTVLNIPFLRTDASNLMGSLVGQSEGNWRSVHNTSRSLKKSGFYMDEVDGLFAGAQSSGRTDGGTTSRLIKSIIQDMQNSEGIFYVFTANDIDNIPDPIIDRLDLWMVELPNDTERGEIFQIHMRHTGRHHSNVCPSLQQRLSLPTPGNLTLSDSLT